ncbi:hypothetical protein [Phascolarctobacterium faecium]|nr:hypothetical protein [Phascolarctobacterium faecium]
MYLKTSNKKQLAAAVTLAVMGNGMGGCAEPGMGGRRRFWRHK